MDNYLNKAADIYYSNKRCKVSFDDFLEDDKETIRNIYSEFLPYLKDTSYNEKKRNQIVAFFIMGLVGDIHIWYYIWETIKEEVTGEYVSREDLDYILTMYYKLKQKVLSSLYRFPGSPAELREYILDNRDDKEEQNKFDDNQDNKEEKNLSDFDEELQHKKNFIKYEKDLKKILNKREKEVKYTYENNKTIHFMNDTKWRVSELKCLRNDNIYTLTESLETINSEFYRSIFCDIGYEEDEY